MFPTDLLSHAERLSIALRHRGWMLSTAESCTGGLIAALFTEIAGASDIFERGFVTYSNAAKIGVLNVPFETLAVHGAVSCEVALAMAAGARRASAADIALSVTGIAGPGGGSPLKPVGLVYVGVATPDEAVTSREFRFSDAARSEIRLRTVAEALRLLDDALSARTAS